MVRNGLQNPIIITIQTPDSKEITINSQWSKERVLEGLKNGTVRFTKTSNGWSLHHKVYMGGGQVLRSILMDCGNNRSAVVELTELFGELYFDYPKPSQLVKIFAKLCTNKDSIILDFFSGSATTAHAVMQLNAEDGGKRKFICVQLPEKTDEQSEAYKAGYKTICEIGKERIRRAGEKILKESGDIRVESGDDDRNSTLNSQNSTLDIGFKVFKLDSSNLVKWDNTPTTDEEEVKKRIQQSLFYLVEGREDLDLVYEIMLKYGLSLTLPVEERKFDGVTAYIINHPDYKVLICLQPNITLSAVEEMDKETIGTYIFADRCFADANILSNTEEILKKKDKEMRLF